LERNLGQNCSDQPVRFEIIHVIPIGFVLPFCRFAATTKATAQSQIQAAIPDASRQVARTAANLILRTK
jgi:hypothetical protein